MELNNFLPETNTSSSRIVQESINVGQGVSAYGVLASFIDTNIAKIDQLAEYLGDVSSQRIVKSKYDSQYFDPNSKFKTFLTRNIYLSKEKVHAMQDERYIYGFLTRTLAESALKYGSRALGNWANKRDTFITCEQVYSILVSYINDAAPNANIRRAKIELNKIRNSLPLSISDKRKLAEKYNTGFVFTESLDISSVLTSKNKNLRDTLAYFITVLSRQLYGADSENDKSISDYYSLIDLGGQYGRELSFENRYNYDNIAADQTAYLQLSRGLMKNMFKDSPHINLESISERANELAEYDPYTVRRKKIKGAAKGGVLTIGGIVSENPEMALNGLATAISQFIRSDEVLQLSKDYVKKLGIGGNEFDVISEDASSITNKNNENDCEGFLLESIPNSV